MMPGSVVNLSYPQSRWPAALMLDSNILIHAVQGAILNGAPLIVPPHASRVARLLGELQKAGVVAIVTPTIIAEVLHVAIRASYEREIKQTTDTEMINRYGRRYRSWAQLAKRDPSIMQGVVVQFRNLTSALDATGIGFIDPTDYDPPPNWRGFISELLDLSRRFSLDSNDARILLEAQSLGIPHIVTLDRDMQRAVPDFTVYTWL